ncbi:hypothetical protein BGY98DRAFT_245232 [Russula aff. rugulosa BPL654]|nr:hypothetical protein BGY98DRAFT_245232 [Russula aff. rugulosa BPL654]
MIVYAPIIRSAKDQWSLKSNQDIFATWWQPEKGHDWATIVDDYQNVIVPGLTHWQHPRFFAYFPTASTYKAMLGDLLSSSTASPGSNVYLENGNIARQRLIDCLTTQWFASPACTELEAVVMDWATKIFGGIRVSKLRE